MKKRFATIMLAALLALGLGAAIALAGCSGDSDVPKEVEEVTSSRQSAGGVSYLNCEVRLAANVNWEGLSEDRRQAVIDYAFAESRDLAVAAGLSNYNITGIQVKDGAPVLLFMYDREHDLVILYSDGQPSGELPAPPSRYE